MKAISVVFTLLSVSPFLLGKINAEATEPVSSLFIVEFIDQTVRVNTLQKSSLCPLPYSGNSTGDLLFSYDSIKNDYGILYDNTVDQRISNFIPTNISNEYVLYYWDLYFKKNKIVAPENGYSGSVPAGKNAYFIRLPDGNFGAIIKYKDFIGAIDRSYYYLVSGKNSRILYKESIVPVPAECEFMVDIFSGRPNPVFKFTNNANIKMLIDSLYYPTVFFTNPALVIDKPSPVESYLGFRSFNFTFIYPGCVNSPTDGSVFSITISVGNGYVTVKNGTQSTVLADKDSCLQKLIIAIGQSENPSYTDTYGTLHFKDLFPDSTKDPDSRPSVPNWTYIGSVAPPTAGAQNFVNNAHLFTHNTCTTVYIPTNSGLFKKEITNSKIHSGTLFQMISGTENLKINSALPTGDTIYIGTEDNGIFKQSINSQNLLPFNNGLPETTDRKIPVILDIKKEGTLVFSYIYSGGYKLYCTTEGESGWVDALVRFNLTTETPIDKLPENIPSELFKYMVCQNFLRKINDSTYVPIIPDTSRKYNDWDISSVCRIGSVIYILVENTCVFCSSTFAIAGVVLKSSDNGKTFKPVIYKNGMPRIHLFSNNKKIACAIQPFNIVTESDTATWKSGIYISTSSDSGWKRTDSFTVYFSHIEQSGNYLLATTPNGDIFVRTIDQLGSTAIKSNKIARIDYPLRSIAVTIGRHTFSIQIPEHSEDITISLCNLQGKVIKKTHRNTAKKFETGFKISEGVYLLRVSSGNYRYSGKVVLK